MVFMIRPVVKIGKERYSAVAVLTTGLDIFSILRGKRGLSLSKAVGFDRLNQRYRNLLRRYMVSMENSLSIAARNSVFSTFGKLAVKAISFGFTIFIVRWLGDAEYGQYVIIWAYISVFAMFSDAGLSLYTIREIAKGGPESHSIAGNVICLRLVLAALTMMLVLMVAWLAGYSSQFLSYLVLASLILLAYAFQDPLDALLQAYERFDLAAMALIVGQLTFVGSGTLFLLLGWRINGLIVAALLNVVVAAAVAAWFMRDCRLSLRWQLQPRQWPRFLRLAVPFGLIKLWLTWSLKIDIVILSWFWVEQMAGWYGAAYAIVLGALVLSNSMNSALYPTLSRKFSRNPRTLPPLYERILKYLLVLSLPMAVGVFFTADSWVTLLYGRAFEPARVALSILIWVVPLAFVSEFFRTVLMATSRERVAVRGLALVVMANILLNLWWIPLYGFLGAAVISVVSEALLVGFYLGQLRSELRTPNMAKVLLAPLGAALGLMLILYLWQGGTLVTEVVLGGGVYLTLIWVFGIIKLDEVRPLLRATPYQVEREEVPAMSTQNSAALPLVSVFIPVYNAGQYVAQAIESVLKQSYPNYELIIIDDGSTDETAQVLALYRHHPRIRLYQNSENLGISPTWNRAIGLCRGTIIAKLDADDFYEPHQMETVVNFYQHHPEVGLVFSGLNLIYPDGRVEAEMKYMQTWVRQRHEFLPALLRLCLIRAPTVFVQRACYDRLGGVLEAMKLHSDWEMWVRIAAAYPVGFIARRLANYRMSHGPNATAQAAVDGRSMHDLQLWLDKLTKNELPYTLTPDEENSFRWGIYELEMHFAAMAACRQQPDLQQAYTTFAEQVIPTALPEAELKKMRQVHTSLHQGLFAFRERELKQARRYFWQAIKTEPRYCKSPWIWSKLLLTFIGRTKWGLMYK